MLHISFKPTKIIKKLDKIDRIYNSSKIVMENELIESLYKQIKKMLFY